MEPRTAQISVDAFMQAFLPEKDVPADLTVKAFDPKCFKTQVNPMYAELCNTASSVFAQAAQREGVTKLVAKDTHAWLDHTDEDEYYDAAMPVVTAYPDTKEAKRAYTTEPSRRRKEETTGQEVGDDEGWQPERRLQAETAWSWTYLCIEAKANPDYSPFVLPTRAEPADATKQAKSANTANSAASSTSPDPIQSQPASPCAPTTQSASLAEGFGEHAPPTASTDSPADSATAGSPTTATPDPVSISPPFMRLDTDRAMKSMGQISRYAAKIMRRQFLSYCFTIFVCNNYAWLMRWDRAGLVISEPFDFIQQPQLLHRFLYRFACMTDIERGCDPTVQPAAKAEIERMRAFTNLDTDWHKAKFLGSVEEGPVVKISVPAADMITRGELERGKKDKQPSNSSELVPPREFLVGKPLFLSNSPTGSGTKGFIAYDVAEDRLVFLKDCWRPEAKTYYPEGEVYLHLHSHNVQYIATPVGAGDVVDDCGGIHTTRADKFLQVDTPQWQHYRLILEEVAMPLEEYTDSYALIDILDDAIRAHRKAWAAGVLHRDVSAFNIMIYWYRGPRNGKWRRKGLLVDWGLCKFVRDLKRPTVQKSRAGTWQFISAVLLVFPGKLLHEVWHDLESFIHVFHWCCLRFHKTNFSGNGLRDKIQLLYDAHETQNGISSGGWEKLLMLRQGSLPFYLLGGSAGNLKAPGLYRILTKLATLCKEHYQWLQDEGKIPETPEPAHGPAPVRMQPNQDADRNRESKSDISGSDSSSDEDAVKRARPVLRAHKKILLILKDALDDRARGRWIDDPKVPDQFAQFKSSAAAQRASAATQSLKRVSLNDDVDENPAKRLKMDGGSNYATVSASDDLISIPEDMPTQAE